MRTDRRRFARWLRLLITVSPLIGGCAALDPPGRPGPVDAGVAVDAAVAAEAARLDALRAQSAAEPPYLRFKAEETQLLSALDDGHLTYVAFESPLDAQTRFYGSEGQLLPMAIAGRVAAIGGLHRGILVQRGDRSSFLSPNPRALSLPRRPLPELPDYAEARAKLENEGSQLLAMQRAQEGVRAQHGQRPAPVAQAIPAQPFPSGFRVPTPSAGSAVGVAAERVGLSFPRPIHGTGVPVPPSVPASPSVPAIPAIPVAPARGLVRVHFASASRAIVAPDDGLGLLLREAARADEIRVTGFTDATGSRAANEALALARAEAVVQILLRRGIPGSRLTRSAVGAADFVADNETDRGRALNRRVEVLLLRDGAPLAFADAAPGVR